MSSYQRSLKPQIQSKFLRRFTSRNIKCNRYKKKILSLHIQINFISYMPHLLYFIHIVVECEAKIDKTTKSILCSISVSLSLSLSLVTAHATETDIRSDFPESLSQSNYKTDSLNILVSLITFATLLLFFFLPFFLSKIPEMNRENSIFLFLSVFFAIIHRFFFFYFFFVRYANYRIEWERERIIIGFFCFFVMKCTVFVAYTLLLTSVSSTNKEAYRKRAPLFFFAKCKYQLFTFVSFLIVNKRRFFRQSL